jgi:hypothetical protein
MPDERSALLPGSDAPGNRGWASIAVDRDGRVLAAWLDHRETVAAASAGVHQHGAQSGAASATDTDHWAACRTRALAVRPISFARSAGTAPALWSRVGAPSTSYEPRHPAQGLLYQIVRDHFETVRAQAVSLRDGEGLPRFVEQEFRAFLQCGWLAGGFALRLSSAASPISSRTSAAPTPIATVAPGVSGRDWPWWSPAYVIAYECFLSAYATLKPVFGLHSPVLGRLQPEPWFAAW